MVGQQSRTQAAVRGASASGSLNGHEEFSDAFSGLSASSSESGDQRFLIGLAGYR
jgi:hypothetical protein